MKNRKAIGQAKISIKKPTGTSPKDVGHVCIQKCATSLGHISLSFDFVGAFLIRFDGELPSQMVKRLVFLWPYVVSVEFIGLLAFGVIRFAWRYVGLREASRIFGALAVVSVLFLILRVVSAAAIPQFPYAHYALIPIGVIVINFGLAFLGIVVFAF